MDVILLHDAAMHVYQESGTCRKNHSPGVSCQTAVKTNSSVGCERNSASIARHWTHLRRGNGCVRKDPGDGQLHLRSRK